MGKKLKTGKHRQDIFYKKAKEAGYRARSAFKLIQLNYKFQFLQKSKVCIDLCAAPGSWMQVAQKYMPPSSVIVGVDLVPIKTIPHTITIVGDITTEKVRQALKNTLKTWKADVVLHDGAPNVGQNWLHDAYQQNLLVLHAFKLACELLHKGGTFVTKVFRSKDYFSLEYVFRKLFDKVETTKPQASRYESAEIFVVCTGFLAPTKIDAEFFDARSVFQEVDPEPNTKLNLVRPDNVRRKAHGYEEGATILFKPMPVSRFLHSTTYLEVLQEASELVFDDEFLTNHPRTTKEIRMCCKDIKVLGRKDLRLLLNWRKHIKAELDKEKEEQKEKETAEEAAKIDDEQTEEDKELAELDKVQEQVEQLKKDKARRDKRIERKVQKEKKKLDERMKLKLMIPGDSGPVEAPSEGLFNLKTLDKVKSLDAVVDQAADEILHSSSDDDDEYGDDDGPRTRTYLKEKTYLDKAGKYYKESQDTDSDESSEEEDTDQEGLAITEKKIKKSSSKKSVSFADNVPVDSDDDGDEANPIITDLVGDKKEERKERKAENWFSNAIFGDLKDIEDEDDETYDIGEDIPTKNVVSGNESGYNSHSDVEKAVDAPDTDTDSDDDDDDTDDDENVQNDQPQLIGGAVGNGITSSVNASLRKKGKKRGLDATGLALATKMIHSKKSKRDMMDAGWNRYMFGDEALPDWFNEDEKKHNAPRIEVDPVDLRMYQERGKSVDARCIKKVVEARARKQRRVKKKMDRARKKAETVTDNADLSEREKSAELKRLYQKALAPLKKKDKQYVVMKKSMAGRKPAGTKGPYKMVDKRLKKDTKAKKRVEKRAKGKGGKGRGKSK